MPDDTTTDALFAALAAAGYDADAVIDLLTCLKEWEMKTSTCGDAMVRIQFTTDAEADHVGTLVRRITGEQVAK